MEITLKDVCMGIGERHEIHFIEIGVDEDHVHFLAQSVPMMSPKMIAHPARFALATYILFERDFTQC